MAAQINLQPAREKAGKDFAAGSPEAMAANARVEYNRDLSYFSVPFLGQKYRVYHPGGKVTREEDNGGVPLAYEIVLLHYLARCSPREVEGTLVAFQELPNGSIYVGPFTNRAIKPLVSIFGNKPGLLVETAGKLGGRRMEMGDAAVTIPVLPKIPITFVLWEGDEEFPASGNVLFDASAPSHLETEDYALLPGLAIWEMKRLAGL